MCDDNFIARKLMNLLNSKLKLFRWCFQNALHTHTPIASYAPGVIMLLFGLLIFVPFYWALHFNIWIWQCLFTWWVDGEKYENFISVIFIFLFVGLNFIQFCRKVVLLSKFLMIKFENQHICGSIHFFVCVFFFFLFSY